MYILVAEDEKRIANSLKKSFIAEGHQVNIVTNGKETITKLENKNYDILLLDWRMPEKSGIEVCATLRKNGNKIPIILLTALSDVKNKIEALNSGADDYITKPFSFEELMARIYAVVRRSRGLPEELLFDNFKLDLINRTLITDDMDLKLPEKEFELLKYFIENKNSIINKEQLVKDVWQLPFYPSTNFIEATVKNLRKKLEEVSEKKYIKTIYAEGYIFLAE